MGVTSLAGRGCDGFGQEFGGVVVCLVSIKPVRSAVCAGGERTAFGLAEDDGLRSSVLVTAHLIFLMTPRELPADMAMP